MQVNAELRLWQHAAVLLTPPATAALTPACLKTSVCVCVSALVSVSHVKLCMCVSSVITPRTTSMCHASAMCV